MSTSTQALRAGGAMPADATQHPSFKLEKLCPLNRKHRRGAAVVEFALIAPVLFLLAFGIIEFGRMVMVQQILTNASREGARLAALDGTTNADFESTVDTYLDSASIDAASATRSVNPALPTSDDYVGPITVSVSVPFDQVSWLPSPLFLGGQTLTATTVMRRENSQ